MKSDSESGHGCKQIFVVLNHDNLESEFKIRYNEC